ncbi:Bax inhibitor-1/YccA family protein [Tersicoccus sp. MR15.9]|uniref:Bax inhibitor-1/YccA family protein n=1 Tax=Tersicoccus mangrovi TaxID=3121635 RepID=UPI002FE61B51
MAAGGNPLLNNNPVFTGRARDGRAGYAPTPPQNPYGQSPYGQAGYGQNPYGQPNDLQDLYNRPSATPSQTGRMTFDDVIVKTSMTLGLVVVGAAIGWFVPGLMLIGMIGGLILGLVNSFKRETAPALILAYAALEGLFLGGLSGFLERIYPGIVVQAVIGTLSVFAVTLLLFRSGKVRATPRAMKFFMIALAGYALFSLVNLGLMVFGVTNGMFGLHSAHIPGTSIPWGVVIGLLAIGLAAFSLIVDFTSISEGVRNGVPARFAWTAAFGLTVTLVWLYVEILRLLAILRGND